MLCLPWELESCPNPFQPLSMPILPQVWAVEADVVATSLLPKVVSELSGRLRQATAQYGAGPPSSPTAQPSSLLIFPNQDFQARCVGGADRLLLGHEMCNPAHPLGNTPTHPRFPSLHFSHVCRLHTIC